MTAPLRQAWELRQQQLDDTAADRLRARAGELSRAWKVVQPTAPAPPIVSTLTAQPTRKRKGSASCPAVHAQSGWRCGIILTWEAAA